MNFVVEQPASQGPPGPTGPGGGPSGPTGPTGATGATGATGPAGGITGLYTEAAAQNLMSAAAVIVVNYGDAVMPLTSAADYVLTAVPTIAPGRNGQLAVLVNTGTHTITLQDMGTLGGSDLRLAATTRALSPSRGVLELIFDSTMGGWVEKSFTNVLAFVASINGFTVDGGFALVREVAVMAAIDAIPSLAVSYVGVPSVASISVDSGQVVGFDYPITLPASYAALNAGTVPPSKAVYKGSSVGEVRTFTVTATVSGVAGLTRTCTITYLNSRYGGVNSQATLLSSAQVVALRRVATDNNSVGSFTANAAAGQYFWYAHRAALGLVSYFAINGERAAFAPVGTTDVTNASGFVESFQQYCSLLSGLGSGTVSAQNSPAPNRTYLFKSTHATADALTDAEINAATISALQDAAAYDPSTSPVSGAGEYLWYLFPSRLSYHTITFYVGSLLAGGMDGAGTGGSILTHVNQWGYSETYRAFRSDNPNLGLLSSWSCVTT